MVHFFLLERKTIEIIKVKKNQIKIYTKIEKKNRSSEYLEQNKCSSMLFKKKMLSKKTKKLQYILYEKSYNKLHFFFFLKKSM